MPNYITIAKKITVKTISDKSVFKHRGKKTLPIKLRFAILVYLGEVTHLNSPSWNSIDFPHLRSLCFINPEIFSATTS